MNLPKNLTPEKLEALKANYTAKGKFWCVENLGLKEWEVRHAAAVLGLRKASKGPFFESWQQRAAKSKIGKKRPAQAEVMRRNHAEGKLKVPPRTLVRYLKPCVICDSEFEVAHHDLISRNVCASKDCIKTFKSTVWERRPHPRGMLGRTHTADVKQKLSIASKRTWANPNSKFHTDEFKQRQSDRQSARQVIAMRGTNAYSRTHKGWAEIGGKRCFFKSRWEVNYARYLQFLKERGEIIEWTYEPKTFWFEAIRRGVRSYTPDFEVTTRRGPPEYHEVKGWMDSKSKTKIARMARYYPAIKLIVIDQPAYSALAKTIGRACGFE